MSATKPTKPTVKSLQKVIDDQNNVIEALMEELNKEKKTIRLPSEMTVKTFNIMVDFLNSVKPKPEEVKDVPERKSVSIEIDPVPFIDPESESHVN
jgi:hypothetical protein